MPTTIQFATLLNLFPEPARVYDVQGRLIVENRAARDIVWPDDTGAEGEAATITVDLGEGWFLRRISSTHTPAPSPNALPGRPLPRPNLQALLAGITHELRNPLAAMLTAASLLQDDAGLSEESVMLLSVVRKEARRMNQIMTEFALYVKPPQPYPEDFDLAELVCEVLAELRDEGVFPASVTVRQELPPALRAHADKHQMHQALHRILENAAEAMASLPNGTLTLRGCTEPKAEHQAGGEAGDGRVLLCIEDNGPGFSPEDLQRAFLPFYSTKPQSTGLGLSTAQVAVQVAGGALWLENVTPEGEATPALGTAAGQPVGQPVGQPARGARVCFALPRAKQS